MAFLFSCRRPEVNDVLKEIDFEISTDEDLTEALSLLQTDSMNACLFRKVWHYETRSGYHEQMLESAKKAYYRGVSCDCLGLTSCAAAYITQMFLLKKDKDSTDLWLDRALASVDSIDTEYRFLYAMVNNMAGVQAIQTRVDYSAAMKYFKNGLAAVEQTEDTLSQAAILRNIAQIYNIREDVSGFEYARRAYDLVSRKGNITIKSASALILSRMYLLKGNMDEAQNYADESIANICDSAYNEAFKLYAYYNYGDICAACGDDISAESYYKLALTFLPSGDATADIRALTSYGNLCLRHNRYDEAIVLFLKAESFFDESNMECQAPVFSGLSMANDAVGNTEKALVYYKKYYNSSTKAINFRNENAFIDLQLKYEQSEHSRELGQKEMEILRKDRNFIVALSALSIIFIVLVSFSILYLKKNAMYRTLVQQNLSFRERLNEEKKIKALKKQSRQHSMLKIYEDLETEMKENKLYRRKDLTLQMLSELMGTNTTYMSDVINSFSGKSFSSYLNSYRMEEVLEELSDPSNTEPINTIFEKAGYTSRTTYTRIFRSEVGCTPSKYREEAQKMHSQACAES